MYVNSIGSCEQVKYRKTIENECVEEFCFKCRRCHFGDQGARVPGTVFGVVLYADLTDSTRINSFNFVED